MITVTVSMPDSLKAFLDEEVSSKGYGNTSEYIRELLRGAQARASDERLTQLLLEGLQSGKPILVTEPFWAELRSDAKAIAQRHRPGISKGPSK